MHRRLAVPMLPSRVWGTLSEGFERFVAAPLLPRRSTCDGTHGLIVPFVLWFLLQTIIPIAFSSQTGDSSLIFVTEELPTIRTVATVKAVPLIVSLGAWLATQGALSLTLHEVNPCCILNRM